MSERCFLHLHFAPFMPSLSDFTQGILMSNIISLLFNTTVLMKYFRSVIIQAKVAFIKSQYTVYRVIFIHFYFCPFSFANGLAPILEIAQSQSCLKIDKKQGQNKTGANTSTSLHVYSI